MRFLIALIFLMPLSAWASYSCDGNNDSLTNTAGPVSDYPWTIAGWVKLNATGLTSRVAGIVDSNNQNNFWMVGVDLNENADGLTRITGTITTAQNAGTFSGTSTWHHVTLVGTSTTDVKIYFDGSGNSASSNPGGTPTGIDGIRFCTDAGNFADANAKVGYFAVWTSVLSTGNIDSLAGGADPCTFSPAPAACWPMTADPNDDIASYDLTVTGATLDGGDNPTITSGSLLLRRRRN